MFAVVVLLVIATLTKAQEAEDVRHGLQRTIIQYFRMGARHNAKHYLDEKHVMPITKRCRWKLCGTGRVQ
ncbi:hypothetical protein GCK32_000232 [Trichostrongylus colubriformis]|uniref:Secreted protein n=1 Tax=Trichostrongylus colubriformis TaxID=6319 RepID=A0AAN8IWG3_TRICO